MDQVVAKKIRKLLRLATSGGPEGEIAQLRADELMEKHGLKITLEDEKKKERLVVENVAGENWREYLMAAVATQHHCKFVINKRAATIGMIVGDELHARHAMEAYETLRRTIEQRCEASWNTIIRVIYDLAAPSVKEMWLHIVRIFATQGVVDRIRGPEPAAAEPVDLPTPEPEPDASDDSTGEPAEEYDAPARPSSAPPIDVAKIINEIGGMHVHMIKEAAISFGRDIARGVDIPEVTVGEQRETRRNLKQIA